GEGRELFIYLSSDPRVFGSLGGHQRITVCRKFARLIERSAFFFVKLPELPNLKSTMSGFRLKLNRLKDVSYASSVQVALSLEQPFEMEYAYRGDWNLVLVKPILLHSVVIFLVQF